MPKVVTFDAVNVTRPSEVYKDKRETLSFVRGEELPEWVPAAELERLEGLGAIRDAEAAGDTPGVVSAPGTAGPEAQAFPGAFEVLRGNVEAAVAAAAGENVDEAARDEFAEAVSSATSPLSDSGTGTPSSAEAAPSPTFAGAIPEGTATTSTSTFGAIATDEQVAAFGVEQAHAYVNQHPDELERIIAAENTRERPRQGVLRLDPNYTPSS